MVEKINRLLIIFLFFFLIYTRFVNIGWGLPYPMHPDERNMANAIQSLNCGISNFRECFNPHFFAYGQFPLYLGYLLIWVVFGFRDFGKLIISFEEAVLALRAISAVASILTAITIIKIIKVISKKEEYQWWIAWLLVIFAPYAIQFAHFGTTESLLMLFYSLIIYLSLLFIEKILNTKYFIVYASLVSGLAIATKVSSAIFLAIPILVIISKLKVQKSTLISNLKVLSFTLGFVLCSLIFAILFSPHNLISWSDFISSLKYESDVATGAVRVFYTRQFENTVPYLFQLIKIFPYALGWPVFILGGLGFFGLSWKNKKTNLLRLAFLIYFVPTGLLYAKWTRFMAPIFPVMVVFAILLLTKTGVKNIIKIIIIIFSIWPGIAYLTVYYHPDVRFQASDWIYKNIPNNSYILSETANVVDIPVVNPKSNPPAGGQNSNYQIISFNFYDLDIDKQLQEELKENLAKAEYIFVPSRRIFANNIKSYPLLNKYYSDLFSGKLGFKEVAEFSTSLNDEQAEETWTVFDHPVIRIYKKV